MPGKLSLMLESFRPRIYRWARTILRHHHDAQDVTQDVLLRLVRVAGTADEPAKPEAWLRRVTYNAALDRTRRKQPAALPPELTLPAETDRSIERGELREVIVSSLAHLSEQQRLVLCAKVFDGLTFARIAEQMDLSVPTVKTHYLRAVRALRGLLAGRGLQELRHGLS